MFGKFFFMFSELLFDLGDRFVQRHQDVSAFVFGEEIVGAFGGDDDLKFRFGMAHVSQHVNGGGPFEEARQFAHFLLHRLFDGISQFTVFSDNFNFHAFPRSYFDKAVSTTFVANIVTKQNQVANFWVQPVCRFWNACFDVPASVRVLIMIIVSFSSGSTNPNQRTFGKYHLRRLSALFRGFLCSSRVISIHSRRSGANLGGEIR